MDSAPLIDPQCTELLIGDRDLGITPSDQDGWRALGECIGSHENLQELVFRVEVNTTHENLEVLLTGVSRNRTVRKLEFYYCDGEWPLGILEIFFRDNQNLSFLKVLECRGEFISSLSAALGGCTSRSLQFVGCEGSGMGEEDVTEFIEALAGLPQLKKLEFCECIVGRRGCGAVAALLQSPACELQEISIDYSDIDEDEGLAVLETAVAASSTLTELSLPLMDCSAAALQSFSGVLRSPTCMLKILDLRGASIGDDTMISFADALVTNHRLEKLILGCDHTISDIGFAAMTRALCNTSSIGVVHSSNHTLQDLDYSKERPRWPRVEMPNDIRNYLRMNEKEDKRLVARKKIFMHFFQGTFSLEAFHENVMAPNISPHLVSWIGRTPDGESFTALFNFLKRMPSLCGNCRPAFRHGGRKRKLAAHSEMSDDAIATATAALAGLISRVSEIKGELSRLREILAERAANGPPPPPPRNDGGMKRKVGN